MKVACIRLNQPTEANSPNQDGWVTVGREYVVLEVCGRGSSLKYRILGDDGVTPALQAAEQFEITSPEIPSDWIFRVYPPQEWELTPAAWSADGFWMAYFDGDASAKDLFEKIASALGARQRELK